MYFLVSLKDRNEESEEDSEASSPGKPPSVRREDWCRIYCFSRLGLLMVISRNR